MPKHLRRLRSSRRGARPNPLPPVRRAGNGLSLGQIAQDLDVPTSVLRQFRDNGDLVPDERGLLDWGQVVALQRRHPALLAGRAEA